MTEIKSPIPSRIYNAATNGHVCGANDVDFGSKVVHLVPEKTFEEQVTTANTIYVIHDDFVLSEDITVPANCVLKFDGGSIGGTYTLTGTNTQIKAADVAIFSGLTIAGTWNCPKINSMWYTNGADSLKQIFNLQNENVFNTIVIGKEDYYVSVSSEDSIALALTSHTNLIITGNIKLQANNLEGYSILEIPNGIYDVSINGGGSIVGDLNTHTGSAGEWGAGIWIRSNNENVTISNIQIENTWGDCVYSVGCVNLNILNCTLDGGGRNGISIIAGKDVTIKGNTIKNVNSKAPKAGICLEPNTRDQIIENVRISDNIITDCFSGLDLAAARSWIKNVIIDNNVITTTLTGETYGIGLYGYKNPSGAEYPGEIKNCENVEVCRNRVEGFFRSITSGYAKHLFIHDNHFKLDKDISSMVTETVANQFFDCHVVNFSNNRYESPLLLEFYDGKNIIIENNIIDTYTYKYNYNYETGVKIYQSSINNSVVNLLNNEIDGGINLGFTGVLIGNKFNHFVGDGTASTRGYNGTGFIMENNSFYEEQDRPVLAFYGTHVKLDGNRFYGAEGRTNPYIRLMSASKNIKVGMTNFYSVSVASPVLDEGTDNVIETP